ncbi:MAG: peptidoglycan-binding protein [Betaproteobacteria bacterium]
MNTKLTKCAGAIVLARAMSSSYAADNMKSTDGTASTVVQFQHDRGLTPSGSLDRPTLSALGIAKISRN